jgi:maltooligosyltrehalose synthase
MGTDVWQDTWIEVPREFPPAAYIDTFTGVTAMVALEDGRRIRVGDVLADFPIALLEATPTIASP